MAARKKYGTADSMERKALAGKAKPKEKVVYDAVRSNGGKNYMSPVGGKRGNRTGYGTGERVVNGRTRSTATVAYPIAKDTWEVAKVKSSDAVVSPRKKAVPASKKIVGKKVRPGRGAR